MSVRKHLVAALAALLGIIFSTVVMANGGTYYSKTPQAQPRQTPPYLSTYQPPASQPIEQTPLITLPHQLGWLKNFYISGRFEYTFARVSNIKITNRKLTDPNLAQIKFTKSAVGGGMALGYRFRKSGILSRVEIEYARRAKFHYNPDPVFVKSPHPISTLESTIKNQTLLFKTYYDFNTGTFFMPYVQAGAGLSQNTVNSTSTAAFPPPTITPPLIAKATFHNSQLAWDVGAGLSIEINQYMNVDLGYQFTDLGKLQWQIGTLNPTQPIDLKADSFYGNSLTVGFTLKV